MKSKTQELIDKYQRKFKERIESRFAGCRLSGEPRAGCVTPEQMAEAIAPLWDEYMEDLDRLFSAKNYNLVFLDPRTGREVTAAEVIPLAREHAVEPVPDRGIAGAPRTKE